MAENVQTATKTETELKLTPPDPVPVVTAEKAAGLVPVDAEKKSKLEEKADGFVAELVAHVAEAIDQFRSGELNASDVDGILFQYSRAAKELWKFCNIGNVHVTAGQLHEGPPIDWWERGGTPRGGLGRRKYHPANCLDAAQPNVLHSSACRSLQPGPTSVSSLSLRLRKPPEATCAPARRSARRTSWQRPLVLRSGQRRSDAESPGRQRAQRQALGVLRRPVERGVHDHRHRHEKRIDEAVQEQPGVAFPGDHGRGGICHLSLNGSHFGKKAPVRTPAPQRNP